MGRDKALDAHFESDARIRKSISDTTVSSNNVDTGESLVSAFGHCGAKVQFAILFLALILVICVYPQGLSPCTKFYNRT